MNRNPIMPFVVIMVLGIGLMFVLAFKGLGDAEKIANGDNDENTEVASSPEDIYKSSCLQCHGADYKGQGETFPSVIGVGDRLSDDEIKDIVTNGKNSMPPGLVKADQADAMVEWLKSLK